MPNFARVPLRGVRQFLREQNRRFVFRRAVRQVSKSPRAAELPASTLQDLIYGWGNEGWSAQDEYIRTILRSAWKSRGPILECGSGLSTLLLGLVAQQTGCFVWSLEHDPFWARKVQEALKRHGIRSVKVCLAGLQSFGSYSWYAISENQLPRDFDLVVCDGPPGDTPGGRYGLLPQMKGRLRAECTILLDDAERAEEKEVLERWARELGSEFEIIGSAKPFARMTVPTRPSGPTPRVEPAPSISGTYPADH